MDHLADMFSEHEQSKEDSLEVLQRLHSELRTILIGGYPEEERLIRVRNELIDRTRQIVESSDQRKRLTKWLNRHFETISQRDGQEDDSGTRGKSEKAGRKTEKLSTELRQWLDHNDKAVAFQGDDRAALLEHLLEPLSSRGGPTEAWYRTFLATGIGLVFIRYGHALRRSYYHWLLCDLLPDKTCRDVMSTLYVPEGAGMIGWVMRHGLIKFAESGDSQQLTQAIWSCFIDPKGRVATEDLVVGNRSWIGCPIIDDQGGPVGVLFCFLPLDGLFVYESEPGNSPFGPADFVGMFGEVVAEFRNELLLALRAEAAARLYEVSRIRANIRGAGSQGSGGPLGSVRDIGRDEWLRQMLFPETVEPDDPLGFQIAILSEEQVAPGSDRLVLKNTVLMREEAFVDELFKRTQLSCLYPEEWAPHFALRLDALSKVYHEDWKQTGSTTKHTPVIPTWHSRGEREGWLLESTRRFLEIGLYPRSDRDPENGKYPAETVAEKTAEKLREQHGSDRVGVEFRKCGDPLQLKAGLDLNSPADRVIDLVVPLVSPPGESEVRELPENLGNHGWWSTGFLRVKCLSGFSIDSENPPSEATSRLRRLYEIFHSDELALAATEKLTDLLRTFEHCFRRRLTFAELKILLDLRFVACEAIVQDITQAFSPQEKQHATAGVPTTDKHTGSPPREESRLRLLENAIDLAGLKVGRLLSQKTDECKTAILAFVERLRELNSQGSFPEVLLVSLWLTRNRPVLEGHALVEDGDRLASVFLRDPGLSQSLRLLTRWARDLNEKVEWHRETVKPESAREDAIETSDAVFRHQAQRRTKQAEKEDNVDTTPLFIPPLFHGNGEKETVECQYLLCTPNGDKSKSELRFEQGELQLDWKMDRFPEPVAVDFVRGRIKANLLRVFTENKDLQLTQQARLLEYEPTSLHSLSDVFSCSQDRRGGHDTIERVNNIVSFMSNDNDPQWRFSGVRVDRSTTVLLAYGDLGTSQPDSMFREPKQLARVRDTAILGAQGDLTLILHSDAVSIARREQERLRWL